MTPAFLLPLDTEAQSGAADPADTRAGGDRATTVQQPAEPITEPIPLAAIHDRLPHTAEGAASVVIPPPAPEADPPAATPIGTWKPELIESRVRIGRRWYRTKAASIAVAAAALAAVAVSSVLVISGGPEQATSVAPQASTTASPAPSSPPSRRAVASTTPPPAPPPPPPTTQSDPAPAVRNNDSWTPRTASPTKKPQIDVTRTPFSAAPPPPPTPGTNSATPGDGRRHCCGIFG